MFSQYVARAMREATYELSEDGQYFATIAGFQGVWGRGRTVEECREDLIDALEGWLVLKLWDNDDDIPVLGELSLIPKRVKSRSQHEPAASPRSRKAS